MPTKPMTLLIIARDQNEGHILRLGLHNVLGENAKKIEVISDPRKSVDLFRSIHPDVIIVHGFASGYSEATVLNIRRLDGKRHTGIIVMANVDQHFDQLAYDNYHAGADDVISLRESLAILNLKILTVYNHKLAADELRGKNHKLEEAMLKDELTGLSNMRGFLAKYKDSMRQNMQGHSGFAVIMMDLDHFKKVNDTTNHMVGSFVIKTVGHILGHNKFTEEMDFAARFGGDEYIIVLHGDQERELMAKADKLRSLIEAETFKFQGFEVKVTASMGLCFVPKGFNGRPEDAVKCADAMLYRSKDMGRNSLTGMILRYPIDFNHIGGAHLIDGNTSSHNNRIAG